jgi:hypothetical protein
MTDENDNRLEYVISFKINKEYLFVEKKILKHVFTKHELLKYKTFSNMNTRITQRSEKDAIKNNALYEVSMDIDDKLHTFVFTDIRMAQLFSETVSKYILDGIVFDVEGCDPKKKKKDSKKKKNNDEDEDDDEEDEEEEEEEDDDDEEDEGEKKEENKEE